MHIFDILPSLKEHKNVGLIGLYQKAKLNKSVYRILYVHRIT